MSKAQATLARQAPRSGMSSKRLRETIDAYSMLAPTILGVLIFFAFPLGTSLYLSFTNARLVGETKFIGLENYIQVFRDPTFYSALSNTFIFSLAAIILSLSAKMVSSTVI